MTQTEIQALFDEASCFRCNSNASLAELLTLALLSQISTNTSGTGAGASNNISGAGSPVGVVTPDAINQFYRDTAGTALWQSTGLTNADWHQWI